MVSPFLRLRRKLLYWFCSKLGSLADPYSVVRNALIKKPGFEEAFRAFDEGDLRRALSIFRELADQGDPAAQHNLGVFYETGTGVSSRQDAAAEEWYRRAAERGLAEAQFNLACVLAADLIAGQAADRANEADERIVEAYMWLVLARNAGHAIASNSLGRLKPHMTEKQLQRAEKLAAQWSLPNDIRDRSPILPYPAMSSSVGCRSGEGSPDGLKGEIEKIVTREQEKLREEDRRDEEFLAEQCRRFQPMRALLQELVASGGADHLKATIQDSMAVLEVGKMEAETSHFETDVSWWIEPNAELGDADDPFGLRATAGVSIKEIEYNRLPSYVMQRLKDFGYGDTMERSLTFETATDAVQYMVEEIAKRLALYRHIDENGQSD